MKIYISILITVLLSPSIFCQQQRVAVASNAAEIIFNGGNIVIANGGQLVIENPNPNALTRTNAGGGILSEAENNNVVWMIGSTHANYVVPFIISNYYKPVSFTPSGATGNGMFILSTYGEANWKNSDYLPPGVTNVNRNGTDNSKHIIDRFWKINASGYTKKPSLTNVKFSYTDASWNESGNYIHENRLAAQRWNDVAKKWSDFAPAGIDDATSNIVTVASINATDLYSWWTLVDSSYAFPAQLSFAEMKTVTTVTPGTWQVFPNPVTDRVYITGNVTQSNTIQVQLISMNGDIIKQQTINDKTTVIPVNNLAAGSYIVRINDGINISTFKIIKR